MPEIEFFHFSFIELLPFKKKKKKNLKRWEGVEVANNNGEFETGSKNKNLVEFHLMIIPAKFGSIWISGFRGEEQMTTCAK